MELDVSLGQDEGVYREYEFSPSLIFFLLNLKSHFWLTNKRLIVSTPNTFLFIPTGKNMYTYHLRNIGSVYTKTDFSFVHLLAGCISILLGLATLSFGLLFILLGIWIGINSFQTVIFIHSSDNTGIEYSYLPWEATEATRMVNELNQVITEL